MGGSSSHHVVVHRTPPHVLAAQAKAKAAAEEAARAAKAQQLAEEQARQEAQRREEAREKAQRELAARLAREEEERNAERARQVAAAKAQAEADRRERAAAARRAEVEAEREAAAKEARRVANLAADRMARGMVDTVNIGVTGQSGAGKSTLINALRGLRKSDPGAAATGYVETTMAPVRYAYKGVSLFDMPGAGTPGHPAKSYVEDQRLDLYSMLVIVTRDRFTEQDHALVAAARRFSLPFLLVRTNFDATLRDDMEENDLEEPQEEECMEAIKKQALTVVGPEDADKVLVVSGLLRCRGQYDFATLQERLAEVIAAGPAGAEAR